MISRDFSRLLIVTVVLVAAGLTACDSYYQAPPSTQITISPTALSSIPLLALGTDGKTQKPSTVQFTGLVYYNKNTKVTWSIDNDIPTRDPNKLGTIDATGLYTAPALLPDPGTVTVRATSQADPTRFATTRVPLVNPPALIASVTPAVVSAGGIYTLDIQGLGAATPKPFPTSFYPNTAVTVTGALVDPITYLSPTEIKVVVHVNASGPLQVTALNANSSVGSTNPFQIYSQPANPTASSSVATLVESVGQDASSNPIFAHKAYIPRTAANTIAVVNVEAGTQLTSIALPAGFQPTAVAANPAHDMVVVSSATTPSLVLIDARSDQVSTVYPVPAAGVAALNSGSCTVCSVIVDAALNVAYLDTASGYFSVNLATGAASTPTAAPTSENFAYDRIAHRILAPFYTAGGTAGNGGAGLNVLDLTTGHVLPYRLPAGTAFSLPNLPSAAAVDEGTELALLTAEGQGQYVAINFNSASVGTGITAPAAAFGITTACSGAWDQVSIEPSGHWSWFGNEGACIGVGTLPTSPVSGALSGTAGLRPVSGTGRQPTTTGAADFNIVLSPATQTIGPADTAVFTLTTRPINSASGNLTLTCVAPVNGCVFSATSIPVNGSTSLNIPASALASGRNTISISATTGTTTHTVDASVLVGSVGFGPSGLRWALVGNGPDGKPWRNAPAPHSLSTLVGLDGTTYGLSLRGDQGGLLRVNLNAFSNAPAIAAGAANQVDASGALTFIPLQ